MAISFDSPSLVEVGRCGETAFNSYLLLFAAEYFLQRFDSISTTDYHVFHRSLLHLHAMKLSTWP